VNEAASAGASAERRGFLELVACSDAELTRILGAGTAPAFDDLVGWEFDGANTAKSAHLIGAAKFRKGFYEGPPLRPGGPEPFIQGYNIDVRSGPLTEAWHAKPSDQAPTRKFFYRVHAVVPGARHSRFENALLLDYGLTAKFSVASPLRDYLVQVYPDDPDLLLGRAYYALGPVSIPLSFFVLKRWARHDFRG